MLTKDVASIDATPLVSSSCLTTGSLGYLNGCYAFGKQLMSHYWQPRLPQRHELLTKDVASIEVTEAASSET
jgi:hypothetical protein